MQTLATRGLLAHCLIRNDPNISHIHKNPIRVLTILFVAYLGHMRSTIWHRGSTFCPNIVLSALGDRLFNRGTNRYQPLDRFFTISTVVFVVTYLPL